MIILIFLSGVFIVSAWMTYKMHPGEISLWAPLSFFGGISLFLSLILLLRFILSTKEQKAWMKHEQGAGKDKK